MLLSQHPRGPAKDRIFTQEGSVYFGARGQNYIGGDNTDGDFLGQRSRDRPNMLVPARDQPAYFDELSRDEGLLAPGAGQMRHVKAW